MVSCVISSSLVLDSHLMLGTSTVMHGLTVGFADGPEKEEGVALAQASAQIPRHIDRDQINPGNANPGIPSRPPKNSPKQ
eukprot:982276-Amphidinium_carterae.1